jgi:hypothetical protein
MFEKEEPGETSFRRVVMDYFHRLLFILYAVKQDTGQREFHCRFFRSVNYGTLRKISVALIIIWPVLVWTD